MTNRFRRANDVQWSWRAVPVNAPSRGRAYRAPRKMESWSVDESLAHPGGTGRPVPDLPSFINLDRLPGFGICPTHFDIRPDLFYKPRH
jgi:hypothetical protein